MALSFVKYTGDGVKVQHVVTFAYISKLHVFVFVDGASVPFVWVNNTLIQTTTAAPNLSVIEIRRDTPIAAPLVDFEDGGTLSEEDLDAATLQALYHNQEQADDISNSINLAFDQEWDALNLPMKNLADPSVPTSITDAINLGFLNTALIGSGNVPVPLDPTDDTKTLIAAAGSWSWAKMIVGNLSDAVATMKTFLTSANLATARTNLGLGSAAVLNQGTGATDLPANNDLGSASLKNTGTINDTIPLLTASGMPIVSGDKLLFAAFETAFNENKGNDIVSAATTDIGAATGNFVDVTGVVTITALGTITAGTERTVRFTGALTITHNATSLINLSGADILTAVNDIAVFRSLGSGNWVMVDYIRKDGSALVAGASFRGALVTTTANTTLTSGAQVAIAFGSEDYDTDTIHDNSTNNTRLSVPSGVTKVRLTGNVKYVLGTGSRYIIISKNGASVAGGGMSRIAATASTDFLNVVSAVMTVVGGTDYFELEAQQDTGSDLDVENNIHTWFSMEIIA